MAIKTETHNMTMCRELETLEHSVINGMTSFLKNLCRRQKECKSQRSWTASKKQHFPDIPRPIHLYELIATMTECTKRQYRVERVGTTFCTLKMLSNSMKLDYQVFYITNEQIIIPKLKFQSLIPGHRRQNLGLNLIILVLKSHNDIQLQPDRLITYILIFHQNICCNTLWES